MFRIVIPILFLFSCQTKKNTDKKQEPLMTPELVQYTEKELDSMDRCDVWNADLWDTGYYKNVEVDTLASFLKADTSFLGKFVQSQVDIRKIEFLNKTGLHHSAYITRDTSYRYDTLWNENLLVSLFLDFDGSSKDYIKINNKKFDLSKILTLALSESSFRHFRFYEDEYYYFEGDWLHCNGIGCGYQYFLLYNIRKKQLSIFETFRVGTYNYFGDINNDKKLDFLTIDNEEQLSLNNPEQNDVEFAIYSDIGTGKFIPLKDTKGKPYYIEASFSSANHISDGFKIASFNWPKKISF